MTAGPWRSWQLTRSLLQPVRKDPAAPDPPRHGAELRRPAPAAQEEALGDRVRHTHGRHRARTFSGWLSSIEAVKVVLRPTCEGLGLEYTGQLERQRVLSWADVGKSSTVGQDGRIRRMVTIDRPTFGMWLATLQEGHVKDLTLPTKVVAYRREAARAIDRHCFGDGVHVAREALQRVRGGFASRRLRRTPTCHWVRSWRPPRWTTPRGGEGRRVTCVGSPRPASTGPGPGRLASVSAHQGAGLQSSTRRGGDRAGGRAEKPRRPRPGGSDRQGTVPGRRSRPGRRVARRRGDRDSGRRHPKSSGGPLGVAPAPIEATTRGGAGPGSGDGAARCRTRPRPAGRGRDRPPPSVRSLVGEGLAPHRGRLGYQPCRPSWGPWPDRYGGALDGGSTPRRSSAGDPGPKQ